MKKQKIKRQYVKHVVNTKRREMYIAHRSQLPPRNAVYALLIHFRQFNFDEKLQPYLGISERLSVRPQTINPHRTSVTRGASFA